MSTSVEDSPSTAQRQARPPLLGLRHVALYVTDLDACERFWVGVLGFTVEWRPDPDNLYLCSGSDNLALHRAAEPPGAGQRLDHVGLALPTAAAVDAWAEYLAGRGVALERGPRTHRDGSRSLYLRDPAGTLVQLIHHGPLCGGQAAL